MPTSLRHAASRPRLGRAGRGPVGARRQRLSPGDHRCRARRVRLARLWRGIHARNCASRRRRPIVDRPLLRLQGGIVRSRCPVPLRPRGSTRIILAGGVDQVGHRLAQHFVDHWEHPEQRDPILSLMQVAFTDPTAAALVREFITVRVLVPLMRRINVDRPELRAGLLASQIGGFGIGRYVLAYDGLTKTPIDDVVAAFGWSLQTTCTGPLSPERGARLTRSPSLRSRRDSLRDQFSLRTPSFSKVNRTKFRTNGHGGCAKTASRRAHRRFARLGLRPHGRTARVSAPETREGVRDQVNGPRSRTPSPVSKQTGTHQRRPTSAALLRR